MKVSPLQHLLACLVICMTFLITGCSSPEEARYVRAGDLFFDDAMSRLSPAESDRLRDIGEENIRGFLFVGERRTCIVLFSVRTDVINHAPDPAYCYDKKSNQFVEKL
jgi:hypothetical protein